MSAQLKSKEAIIRGGDVEVEAIHLYSSRKNEPYDLANIWQNISIFENIERNYIEGTITLLESQDLLARIPISTNEKIVIKFITPSRNAAYTFVGQVVEIPTRMQLSQGSQTYVLKFVSPEFVKDKKIQFSKSYNKTLISNMAQKIFDQYIKDVSHKTLFNNSTLNTTSHVIPTMSPFQAMNWLCNWAVSPSYRSGFSYVFFEFQKGYYFGPIEHLVDSNPVVTYKKRIVNTQQGAGGHDVLGGFYNVFDLTSDETRSEMRSAIGGHSYIKNVTSGMYASKTATHDIVLRTIKPKTYNYFEQWENLTHLETSSGERGMLHNDTTLGQYPDSFVRYTPEHYAAFNEQPSFRTSDSALIRNSQLQQFFAVRLNISVPGDSSRSVGDIIKLEVPAASPTIEDKYGQKNIEIDKYLSGRYLITALRHQLERSSETKRESYTLHMVISKDSYQEALPRPRALQPHNWDVRSV